MVHLDWVLHSLEAGRRLDEGPYCLDTYSAAGGAGAGGGGDSRCAWSGGPWGTTPWHGAGNKAENALARGMRPLCTCMRAVVGRSVGVRHEWCAGQEERLVDVECLGRCILHSPVGKVPGQPSLQPPRPMRRCPGAPGPQPWLLSWCASFPPTCRRRRPRATSSSWVPERSSALAGVSLNGQGASVGQHVAGATAGGGSGAGRSEAAPSVSIRGWDVRPA